MLRGIAIALMVYVIIRLLAKVALRFLVPKQWREVFEKARQSRPQTSNSEPAAIGKAVLVEDPICKLNLPMNEALVEKTADGDVYFCSEKCRQTFLQSA